ncbi:MAG: hypothetical protein IJ389_05065 [Clostridia bacterium]|nr:hypothetical protein [Clostridia bacterium]
MKKLFCVIFASIILLCSCSTKNEIVGTWEGSYSYVDINATNVTYYGILGEYVDFTSLSLSFTYEFSKEGTYTLCVDSEKYLAEFTDVIEAAIEKYCQEHPEESGTHSASDFIPHGLEEQIASHGCSGKYLFEDGKLYLSYDSELEADKSSYILCELSGSTLTFLEKSDATVAQSFLYPATLTKK